MSAARILWTTARLLGVLGLACGPAAGQGMLEQVAELPHRFMGPSGITAASAILMDADSGLVLWSRDPDVPRFPASTTKILTALLLVENTDPDEEIVAPADVEAVGQASMHLRPGERVSARDMLSAILLRSANDGSYAVACHIAGSEAEFAELMNRRARELGARRSHFVNPHGLHHPEHVTTARDLALIAREAMRHPEIREVVRRRSALIERSANGEDRLMVSRNRLLALDPTADGIKTGWTVPAGRCFVGSATRNGYRLIAVVLKSEDWLADTLALLDWGFRSTRLVELAAPAERVASVSVIGGERSSVDAIVPHRRAVVWPRWLSGEPERRAILEPPTAPVVAGQRVGTLLVTHPQGGRWEVPLVAAESVPPAGDRPAARAGLWSWGSIGIAFALAAGALVRRRGLRKT